MEKHVPKGNFEMFSLPLGLKSKEVYQRTSSLIEFHLEELYIRIENHFPSLLTQVYDWVRDPYAESAGHPECLTLKNEEEICELQIRFIDLSLNKFWISVKEEYPTIHKKTIGCSFLQPSG